MAWITPTNVSTGDLLTATSWNQNVVENMKQAAKGHLILTTTERNALTGVVTGQEIYNTTTGAFEVWNGSSWQIGRPFASASAGAYGGASPTTVNFPTGRFSVTPMLQLTTFEAGGHTRSITSVTSTGFTFQSNNGANITVQYYAVQMTATSATG